LPRAHGGVGAYERRSGLGDPPEEHEDASRVGVMRARESDARFLVVAAASRLCALNLSDVIETLRPPAIVTVAGAPSFVLGLALIRGHSTPVVDLGALLGGVTTDGQRLVTLRVGTRAIAVLVERVAGLHTLDPKLLASAPRLLGDTTTAVASELGALDSELLVLLRASRLLPSELWATLESAFEQAQTQLTAQRTDTSLRGAGGP
jgi:purine-binding chemotaxis protein CheW